MIKNVVFAAAAAFVLLPIVATSVKAEPVRVASWPAGVPCSSLRHNPDGSWTVIDIVLGNGAELQDVTLKGSSETTVFDRKCGQPAQK